MDHIAFASKFETTKGLNAEHRAKFGDLNSSSATSGALLAAVSDRSEDLIVEI